MHRRARIAGAAGAAVGFGCVLWALASTDLPERITELFVTTPPLVTVQPQQAGGALPAVESPKRQTKADVAPAPAKDPLAIEIARIEAGGPSVLAGRAPPNHRVTVLANGREIASVVASDEGQWSAIIDGGITPGALELKLTSRPPQGGAVIASAPRHLTVPAPPPSKMAAAPVASAAASALPKTASAPPARRELPQAPRRQAATGDAVDKRALAEFEALVARARTEMAAGKSQPQPPAASEVAGTVASAATPPVNTSQPTIPGGPPGRSTAPATIAAAPSDGAAARSVSDALPDPAKVPIPIPITFETDDITLTEDGERAAALLAEYLRIKRPEGISLSGHADRRGPDGYNMELSRRRLEVIERYLRKAGYGGRLSLLPRGKREPYLGIDRKRLSRWQIYQADRRVELRVTQ